MRRKAVGTIYGAIAAASYGTNPLFALPLFAAGIGVNSVLFYRYFIAALIYFFIIKFIKKISLKINIKEFIGLFILGMLFSFSSITLFAAFNYIESGIACTILFMYPILVSIIMTVFYKEKLSLTVIIAIILTTVGIILLYNGKTDITLNSKGIYLVLASALFYALYIVFVKKIKIFEHMKSDKLSFYVILFGLLVYIYNLKFCTRLQILNTPSQIINVLGLAIIPTILSIETISISIKLIGSTYTAILGALEPLTAVFFGVLLFNEILTLKICIGILSILSGVIIIVLKNRK